MDRELPPFPDAHTLSRFGEDSPTVEVRDPRFSRFIFHPPSAFVRHSTFSSQKCILCYSSVVPPCLQYFEPVAQKTGRPMAESQSASEQTPVDDLTPEEANRIIHSHRKVRYGKLPSSISPASRPCVRHQHLSSCLVSSRVMPADRAHRSGTACWPCRQRKVKCDNKQPCENCVKRDHAQLCSYKPNRSSSGKQGSVSSDTGGSGRKRAHSPDSQDREGKNGSQSGWPRTIGEADFAEVSRLAEGGYPSDLNTANVDDSEGPEVSRFVGMNSIPALLREQSPSSNLQEVDVRQDMRSILGLDTSAPFPLMSSRHLERLTQEITAELPSDREVMKSVTTSRECFHTLKFPPRLFRTYKETPQQFWGFVMDIDDLESKLMVYLEDRARNAKSTTKAPKPVSASWLAILFAVLAVGSQYHDSPYHVRTSDSQKYIQISFHFLRLGNFLLRCVCEPISSTYLH
jgi:hypothetical protein